MNTDLCAAEFFQTVVAAVTLFVPTRTADTRGQRQQETRAETKQRLWGSWPRCPCLNQELPPSEAPLDLWPLSSVSESLLSLYPATFTATVQSVAQLKQLQEPFVRRDSPSCWGWRLHVTLTAWWSVVVWTLIKKSTTDKWRCTTGGIKLCLRNCWGKWKPAETENQRLVWGNYYYFFLAVLYSLPVSECPPSVFTVVWTLSFRQQRVLSEICQIKSTSFPFLFTFLLAQRGCAVNQWKAINHEMSNISYKLSHLLFWCNFMMMCLFLFTVTVHLLP